MSVNSVISFDVLYSVLRVILQVDTFCTVMIV